MSLHDLVYILSKLRENCHNPTEIEILGMEDKDEYFLLKTSAGDIRLWNDLYEWV